MPAIKPFRLGLLICIVGALGASAPEGQPAASRYIDPVEGFSIAPPASAQSLKERAVVASFPVGLDDGFGSNINILVDPGKTTYEAYVPVAIQQFKEQHKQANFRLDQKMQVSGKPAHLIDVEASIATVPNRRLRFLQLTVIADDRVYIVTCTAPAANFASREAEFRKCIDSFRVE